MAREDLSMTQKDKFMLQAKVSELKNNMKTLLQQNQQLKLDLRRGAAKTVWGRPGHQQAVVDVLADGRQPFSHKVTFNQCWATTMWNDDGIFFLDHRPYLFNLVLFLTEHWPLSMNSDAILL